MASMIGVRAFVLAYVAARFNGAMLDFTYFAPVIRRTEWRV